MAKYITKNETISDVAKTIMAQVLQSRGGNVDNGLSVLKSFFMKLHGLRDYPAYEVAHHNLTLSMVETSFNFENVPLRSRRYVNKRVLKAFLKKQADMDIDTENDDNQSNMDVDSQDDNETDWKMDVDSETEDMNVDSETETEQANVVSDSVHSKTENDLPSSVLYRTLLDHYQKRLVDFPDFFISNHLEETV